MAPRAAVFISQREEIVREERQKGNYFQFQMIHTPVKKYRHKKKEDKNEANYSVNRIEKKKTSIKLKPTRKKEKTLLRKSQRYHKPSPNPPLN